MHHSKKRCLWNDPGSDYVSLSVFFLLLYINVHFRWLGWYIWCFNATSRPCGCLHVCGMFDVPWENTDVSALIPLWGIHTLLPLGVKRLHAFNRWITQHQSRVSIGCVEVCVGLTPSLWAHNSLCAAQHQHQEQMYSHIHTGVPRGPREEVELAKNKTKHIKWKASFISHGQHLNVSYISSRI